MTIAISIEAKTIGLKKESNASWEIFINQVHVKYTLRELITSVVQEEVDSYNQKYHHNRLSSVLSFDDIEQGKAVGKIGFADKSSYPIIDPQKAVEKALATYQEGHFFVFVDDFQVNDLDDEVILKANSKIAFLRLTPLRGG
jgi:hypothetical protein